MPKEEIRRWTFYLTGFVWLASAFVFLGWWLDIDFLKSPIPNLASMNPVTAVGFNLSSLAFFLIFNERFKPGIRTTGLAMAVVIFLLGLAKMLAVIFDLSFQVDQLLFKNQLVEVDVSGNTEMSSMSINGALNLMLVGFVLWMARRRPVVSQSISIFVFGLAWFPMLGYLYSVPEFYGLLPFLPMAIHSAFCFLLLSISLFFVQSDEGWSQEFTSPYEGGRLARVLIPLAIVIPTVLGFARVWSHRNNVFSVEFGIALLISSIILIFVWAVGYNARLLNKRDSERRNLLVELASNTGKLKDSNEEIATINEELRAANEELTSTNEELFALNEKLTDATKLIQEQSETIIRQKDEHLNRVLDSSDHIIWSIDMTGKGQDYISRSVEKIWGLSPEQFHANKPIREEMVYPPDRELWYVARQRLFEFGRAHETVRFLDSAGNIHWMRMEAWIIKDENGTPLRQEGVASDISVLKEKESELLSERKLIRSVINNIPDYIFVKDTQSRHVINNRANVELLGASSEQETLGKTLKDYLGETNIDYLRDDRYVLSTGLPIVNKEEIIRLKNGDSRTLLTTKVPLKDEDGNITGLAGISRDITELRVQEQLLNQYRKNLDIIFSNTIEEILLLDAEGKVVTFNRAFENFIEVSTGKKPVVGEFVWDITVKERREIAKEIFLKATRGERITVDASVQTPHGNVVHEIKYEPVLVNGEVRHVTVISVDVTEKRKNESLLKDFQDAIYRSSIVSRADIKGNITYVNENFITISGYSKEELIGQNHRLVNSGHHPKGFWVNMWKTIVSGAIWREEVKNKTKGGDYYWVDTFVMPFLNEEGNVQEFLSIRNDITHRKKIEEDLEQSRYLLAKSNEVAQIGSWSYDPESNKIEWNEQARRIFGIAPDYPTDFEGYLNIVHRDDRERVLDTAIITFKERRPYDIEHTILRRSDHAIRWVHERADFITDEKNSRLLIGIVQDITDRKTLEETLKVYNDRYETVSKATNDAIWDWDIEKDTEQWNHGIESILGYKEREINQSHDWWSEKVHPDDRARINDELQEAFRKKNTNWLSQYQYQCADGSYKHILDRAYILYHNEKPIRVIGAMQDITEVVNYREGLEKMVKERTSELNEALDKEKELVEMKSKFVSIASHEFRTPLSTISLATGFIRKYQNKMRPTDVDSKLANIEKQVDHMTYLLDDILLVGKADSGKMQIKLKEVEIELFENLAREVIKGTGAKHKLLFSKECTQPYIVTDEKLIRNIIMNLITNAVKFSPDAKQVFMTVKCDHENLFVLVKDTGIGIPSADLKSVFTSFSRGGNVGNIEGTGLGLSIVKKACDLLNGKIEVQSEIGKGTEFRITLPMRYK